MGGMTFILSKTHNPYYPIAPFMAFEKYVMLEILWKIVH